MTSAVTVPADAVEARQADPGRDRDFRKLWAAISASLVGSQVTALALPLLAALTLRASPVQMGLPGGAGQLPFLLVSLPAGSWIDRVRRRPVLIATAVGCALLLLSVPLAGILGWLGFAQLYLVAFGVGCLVALGEIAHYAYVPALVGRAGLIEANSRIQISHSAAASAGPGLAGVLVQVSSAPLAISWTPSRSASRPCCCAPSPGPSRRPRGRGARSRRGRRPRRGCGRCSATRCCARSSSARSVPASASARWRRCSSSTPPASCGSPRRPWG